MDEGEDREGGWLARGVRRERETDFDQQGSAIYVSITPSTPCVETDSQDLLEELLSNLIHLIVEVPLL